MAKNNPRAAKVSVYGDWGSAEDIIYSNWEVSDFDIASLKTRTDVKFLYGLDFGYATSYNAFIAVAIEPLTHTMWIFDEMYERGMTNLDIAKRLTEKGYAKEIVTADAAEPKSIYELQQGFIEEVMDNGEKVNVRYSMPNIRAAIKGPDSVNNGIARVQEYHIYVHHTCKNTIVELNNYAWSKDKDGRLTNKPEKEYDHCLVAGTLVTTDHGDIPIEDVKVGDRVLCHLGYRPVTASGITQFDQPIWALELEDGTILEGTWNHPIITKDGVKYLKDITESDEVIKWVDQVDVTTLTQNIASTMDYCGTDIQSQPTVPNGITSNAEQSDCIDMCGKNTTGPFQKEAISTTSMGIPQTMTYPTSSLSHLLSTGICTPIQRSSTHGEYSTLPKIKINAERGTLRLKDMNGINNTSGIISGPSDISSVSNAGRNSRHRIMDIIAFAHPPARQNGVVTPDSMTRYAFVRYVVSNTAQANIANPTLVRVNAVWLTEKRRTVYDLTVDEAHDFFANGILTLNCMDALRYALSMELLKGRAGIVEARGEDRPSRVASSIRDTEPINTFRNSKVLNITGPTDVAPPKKKRRWVFSSIPDDAADRDPSGKGFFR